VGTAVTAGFDLDAINAIASSSEPTWLTENRREAFRRFQALEWPDPNSEEWRYTDLKGFDLDTLKPAAHAHERVENLDGVPPVVLAALGDVGDRGGLAIQLDADVISVGISDSLRQRGVIFTSIAEASRDHGDLVRDVIGASGVPASDAKYAALAAAFATGGTFVYVPRGVDVEVPLQSFRWLAAPGMLTASRTIVVAEEASSVTFIDHVTSPEHGDAGAASISLVELYAHPASSVSYLSLQDHAEDAWHFHIQRGLVGRDATLRSLAATLGAKFSRSVVETLLNDQGASSEMLGVYFADGDQHFDHRSLQEHAAPSTTSELVYKGALKGESRAVYSGLIHIAKDARRADANQVNRNLVLSEHAKADSIPYLEIENNDVRCGHGASVGPPDEDQVFYLRSRGLDDKAAQDLIVTGYFQEVLDRVRVPEVRDAIARAVELELGS
jgi:Fe-S cluster assembly protein SufD